MFLLASPRTRTGKIARLPQPLREQVNLMLQDNRPYRAILDYLAHQGFQFNYHSLKRWRQGGYQDWLKARQRAAHAQLREEFLKKLLQETDSAHLPPTMVQLLGAQCFDLLLEFERESHLQQMKTNPIALVQFVETLLQLARFGANLSAPPPFPALNPPSSVASAKEDQPFASPNSAEAGPAAPKPSGEGGSRMNPKAFRARTTAPSPSFCTLHPPLCTGTVGGNGR